MRTEWSDRLTAGAAAHPKRVLAVVLAVVALFALAARDVRLDNNFAALFATDSDDALFRQEHRDRWGPDDGLLVAVLRADGDAAATAELVDDLTTALEREIPAVARVDSVTSLDVIGPGSDGTPVAGPPLGADSPFDLPFAERVELANRSQLGAADLVDEDGRTFLVVGVLGAEYDSYESVVGPAQEFQALVEDRVSEAGASVTVRFSGVAFTRIAAIDQMQSDLFRLSPLATLAMAAILFAVFRRAAAVIGPLMAMGAAIVTTAGVIGLAGDDLNQVTIIYPILLMGVVVSGSTHLAHRFYRERATGCSASEASRRVMARLSGPAFVAAFTTAVGFASLVVAEMRILHEFGTYLAVGVVAALVFQLAVVPAVLTLADSEPPASYLATPASAGGTGWDERYVRFLLRPLSAIAVLGIGVGLSGASVLFARTATFDYALTDMLAADHPVAEGNRIIDEDLSGVVPIEVALQGPAESFRDPEVLGRVHELATWLEDAYDVRTVSLAGVVEDLAGATGTGAAGFPDDPAVVTGALQIAEGFRDGEALDALVRDDWSQARMFGFSTDLGGHHIVGLRERTETRATELLAGTGVSARVTGEAPVAYAGMNDLTRELVTSTMLAMVMIVIAILAVFRNGWLTLVSILPNIAPILVGLGLYRLTSDILDPLPGIVLCIAIGLAADDTIHLINRWREIRRQDPGLSASDALVGAVANVRRAMVSSTVVLVVGFGTLTLSTFGWNRQLGALGSVVLVLALSSDLLFGVAGLALVAHREDRRRARVDERAATPDPVDPEPVDTGVLADEGSQPVGLAR
jgi:uncharacterized protein